MAESKLVIVRNKPKDNVEVPYHHLFDSRLSLKAKGLLSLVFSLPKGDVYENFSIKDLIQYSKDGKDSTMSALKELEFYGYLKTYHRRDIDGRYVGLQYLFYDIPKDMLQPVEEL